MQSIGQKRLIAFSAWIKHNRWFSQEEMVSVPLTDAVLMYFAGYFCEKPRAKYCKESKRSICRVIGKSSPNWVHDEICQFVIKSEGGWELTEQVKSYLEEKGIRYYSTSTKPNNDKINEKVSVGEVEPKIDKKIVVTQYNHNCLWDWYTDFAKANGFTRYNDGDKKKIESIDCDQPKTLIEKYLSSAESNLVYSSSLFKFFKSEFSNKETTPKIDYREPEIQKIIDSGKDGRSAMIDIFDALGVSNRFAEIDEKMKRSTLPLRAWGEVWTAFINNFGQMPTKTLLNNIIIAKLKREKRIRELQVAKENKKIPKEHTQDTIQHVIKEMEAKSGQ